MLCYTEGGEKWTAFASGNPTDSSSVSDINSVLLLRCSGCSLARSSSFSQSLGNLKWIYLPICYQTTSYLASIGDKFRGNY